MDALLAEDVAAAQRRLLLRLLTHVPLLRNPSRPTLTLTLTLTPSLTPTLTPTLTLTRQLPLLLHRQHGAPAPDQAAASGGEGRLADNGKRISDLLPACIEALFAQQPPPAGTGASSGASPDSCAAAQ